MIDRFERFTNLISSAYRQIQRLERDEMEKLGYKGAYAQYLVAMYKFKNGITASELCDMCDKDKAAVSRIINEMEQHGLLTKSSNKEHSYRAKITLTERGVEVAKKVYDLAVSAVAAVNEEISHEDRNKMYNSLELLVLRLEELVERGIS